MTEMTDVATPTLDRTPFVDPIIYWRVTSFALAAVALLGIALVATENQAILGGFLAFDSAHNVLHVVLALAAFLFGFATLPDRIVRTATIGFGAVYALLGLLGFFLHDVGAIHLEVGENLIHLLLGSWGLLAGLAGRA